MSVIATSPENAFFKESLNFLQQFVTTSMACSVKHSSRQDAAGALAVQEKGTRGLSGRGFIFLDKPVILNNNLKVCFCTSEENDTETKC